MALPFRTRPTSSFLERGDFVGLVEAVIAPQVDRLRAAVESGPAPLGPGGEPRAALTAFVDALLDFVWANRALIRALESRRPYAYYANPASAFWIAELSHRLAGANPSIDADYLALALFTNMRADVLDYLETRRGFTRERIRKGIHTSVPAWF